MFDLEDLEKDLEEMVKYLEIEDEETQKSLENAKSNFNRMVILMNQRLELFASGYLLKKRMQHFREINES